MPTGKDHEPTQAMRQRVRDLAQAGIPVYLIAKIIGLAESTVKKYYTCDLIKAEPEMIEQVSKVAMMRAMEGNDNMIKLILSKKGAKYGWVEKQVIDNISNEEELQALKDKLNKLEKKHEQDY